MIDLTCCPYCGEVVVFCPHSDHRYALDYGPIYECAPCRAWVGCHRAGSRGDGTLALGTVANAEDRSLRKRAHAVFDPLWQRKMDRGFRKHQARSAGYLWLANELGIPVDDCHMSQMDGHQLRRVIALCEPWTKAL